MKVEQYWVIDINGVVIFRTEQRSQATAFAGVFQRGCEVLAVARVPR